MQYKTGNKWLLHSRLASQRCVTKRQHMFDDWCFKLQQSASDHMKNACCKCSCSPCCVRVALCVRPHLLHYVVVPEQSSVFTPICCIMSPCSLLCLPPSTASCCREQPSMSTPICCIMLACPSSFLCLPPSAASCCRARARARAAFCVHRHLLHCVAVLKPHMCVPQHFMFLNPLCSPILLCILCVPQPDCNLCAICYLCVQCLCALCVPLSII